jgi:hypothetical protein
VVYFLSALAVYFYSALDSGTMRVEIPAAETTSGR